MPLSQDSNGAWIDDPATGFGGQRLNENFIEIFKRAPKVNFTAIVNPTVSNDSSQGYNRNSIWINTATNTAYRCLNPAAGAAVWQPIANATTLANHLSDNANPHNTTAAQVGAVSTSDFNTRVDAISDPATDILSAKGLQLNAHDFITAPEIQFQNPDLGTNKWMIRAGELDFAVINQYTGRQFQISTTGEYFIAENFQGDGSLLTNLTAANVTGLGTAAFVNTGTDPGEIPILSSEGLLPSSVFPPLLTTEIWTTSDEAGMLSLIAQRGDIAIRTDNGKTYILYGEDPTDIGDWVEIQAVAGVTSVNSQTGTVVLNAANVGALSSASPSWSGNATGNGSLITNINASNLATGTVANARTSASASNIANAIVLRDNNGDFSAHSVYLTGNLDIDGTLNAGQFATIFQTLTDAATINWNLNIGAKAQVTLGGNRTIAAPTNIRAGADYQLYVKQDATGNRLLTWNAVFKWANGVAPALSTGANAIDIISFTTDGTNLYGVLAPNFS